MFLIPFLTAMVSAPVPPPRPLKQPSPVGVWNMEFLGSDWEAEFKAEGAGSHGTYWRRMVTPNSIYWTGEWSLDGSTLRLAEHRVTLDDIGPKYVWVIKLRPGTFDGMCDNHPFHLTRVSPRNK